MGVPDSLPGGLPVLRLAEMARERRVWRGGCWCPRWKCWRLLLPAPCHRFAFSSSVSSPRLLVLAHYAPAARQHCPVRLVEEFLRRPSHPVQAPRFLFIAPEGSP